MAENREDMGASASPKPALVASDQAPSGLAPTGFDPARERCDTCRFFRPAGGNLSRYTGTCRLHAPVMECVAKSAAKSSFGAVYGSTDGIWPRVRPDDFCGEYSAASPQGGPNV